MRVFLGVPLPDPTLALLERLQGEIPVGRAVDPETLHITLAFLEEQPSALLEALHERLSEISAPTLRFRLQGLCLLGGKNPRVLAAEIAPNPELGQLHRKIRALAQEVGIALPRTRFRPHVTVLRFARRMEASQLQQIGQALQAHGDFCAPPFQVDHFNLYSSTLLPQGPRYEVLAQYPLVG